MCCGNGARARPTPVVRPSHTFRTKKETIPLRKSMRDLHSFVPLARRCAGHGLPRGSRSLGLPPPHGWLSTPWVRRVRRCSLAALHKAGGGHIRCFSSSCAVCAVFLLCRALAEDRKRGSPPAGGDGWLLDEARPFAGVKTERERQAARRKLPVWRALLHRNAARLEE